MRSNPIVIMMNQDEVDKTHIVFYPYSSFPRATAGA
jgi:hypothetical protein